MQTSCFLGAPLQHCANWGRGSGGGAVAKKRMGKRKGKRVAGGRSEANICPDPCDQELYPCLRYWIQKLGCTQALKMTTTPGSPNIKESRSATPLPQKRISSLPLSLITPRKLLYGYTLWQVKKRKLCGLL